MSVETNEDVKKVNENIQVAFDSGKANNTGGVGENEVNPMEATQRIVILKELMNDTENSKKEFLEALSAQKSSEKDAKNVEKLNSESQTNLEKSNIEEKSIENTQNQNLKEKPDNAQNMNSQEKEKKHKQDKKDYRLERMLFDRINTMQGKIKESLELIQKFERINAKEENLPNIVTTLHDKLTQEVIKQFRTVGIEFNMKSYLVQSIVSDLLNKFEEGITEFKDCSENLNFVREVQEDFESRVELVSTSRVKNLIARLRGLFKPERKQEKLEQLERERQEKKLEEANIHLIKYKFKNSELEKYTIRNNIISSLSREILTGPGSGLNLTVTEFIEQKIMPEMKKLGLENLILQLEDNLLQEYKYKQPNTQKEELLDMQVGELKRNVKASRIGYVRAKVNLVNTGTDNEEERMVV